MIHLMAYKKNTASLFAGVLIAAGLGLGVPDAKADNGQWIITKNPYEYVDWGSYGQHLGSLHNHTTESDGADDPSKVIDDYRAAGYEILAITDHNNHTWPWSDYGRHPEKLGMVAIPSNELSRHHHTNSHFTRYPQPFRDNSTGDLETSLAEHEELGGFAHLNHPGRYWSTDDDGEVPEDVLEDYIALFKEYPSLLGFEIHNQNDRYPQDRLLWDALLTEFMPRRAIWGFANDDSHNFNQIGLNATHFVLPDLTLDHAKLALIRGQFYSSAITTHPSDERDRDETPLIRHIEYDEIAGTLMVVADSGGATVPESEYTWISAGGEVVQEGGKVLDLNNTEGLDKYLRVEIRGEGGTTYTQPFGVRQRPE